MRFTLVSTSSATLKDRFWLSTVKFTGFDMVEHIVRTDAKFGKLGAKSTSAPAFSYAIRRLIVSSKFGLPRTKFSARAASVKGNGSDRDASTLAATRSVASAIS